MIVKKEIEPLKFTNIYPKETVCLIIEVKSSGVFYKSNEVEKRLREWRNRVLRETEKPVIYLSFYERSNFDEKTVKALGSENAFILKVDNEIKMVSGKDLLRE
ncbi:MAG: hypothetical protein ACTSSP_08620 [Candidatus Asgardarchaeia archaeon]